MMSDLIGNRRDVPKTSNQEVGNMSEPRTSNQEVGNMSEPRSFSTEIWVADREAFIFRCLNQRFGDKSTFCVPRSTLQALKPRQRFMPAAAFDALRPVIYLAATERIRAASAIVQHTLTAHELRAAEALRGAGTGNGSRAG